MRALPRSLATSLEARGRDLTLVVVRLSAIGDVLRTVPPARLLRSALPHARIFWVVEDRCGVVLAGHPDLDGVLSVPRREWAPALRSPRRWPELAESLSEFADRLRRLRPDLLLDFHGNLRSGLIAGMSRAPVRLGYEGHQQKEGNRLFTTHRVASGDRRTPRMERNLDLVRALGIPDSPLPSGALPLVGLGAESARRLRRELGLTGPYAVLSPGVSLAQAYKKPPPELLAAACHGLEQRGVASLVVWGPGEERDAAAVVDLSPGAILAPATDLATLASLVAGARLLVAGDTGPLHLACAAGTPVLGIYGPTDPRVNRPWGVPYRALHPPGRRYTGIKRTDREAGGFEGLGPADVTRAIGDLLGERRPASARSAGAT